jgi:hypothetical protein
MYRFPATHPARYNDVRFKASHNSYARKEGLVEQLQFDRDDPHQAGCRGLELDISPNEDATRWSVSHDNRYYPEDKRQLSVYLQTLKAWSADHQDPPKGANGDAVSRDVLEGAHDVVTLTLDIKGVPKEGSDFPAKLDAYIEEYLGANLFKPADLLGDEKDLYSAAKRGWPTLGELAGKFIVCLSGAEEAKRVYNEHPAKRACFVDRRVGPDDDLDFAVDMKWRVFLNADIGNWKPKAEKLKHIALDEPLVIRSYFTSGDLRWKAAVAAGANVIATDKVKRLRWAEVGDLPFSKI